MGKNHKKINYSDLAGLLLVGVSALMAMGLVSFGQGGGGSGGNANVAPNQGILNAICTVFVSIKNIIFILGLTLMIVGGAMYAGANLMPSQQRGGFQGYGMAMIIGGVIGVAIAVAAPFVLNLVLSTSGNSNATVNANNGANVNGITFQGNTGC